MAQFDRDGENQRAGSVRNDFGFMPFHRRNLLKGAAVVGVGLTASACLPSSRTAPVEQQTLQAPPPPTVAASDVIGNGPFKVALLAPKTAGGKAGLAGISMVNAARLAMAEFPRAQLTISVYDTTGSGSGAASAAQQALTDGARLILGPFFADEVRGAAPIARGANVPMIAFSSDPSVAQPGVYIMGFLVQDEVRQLMVQAKAAGKRSIAALLQPSAYGTLAEGALRQYASQAGIRITQVMPLQADPAMIATTAQTLAAFKDQIDCIFVPDGAGVATVAAPALAKAGVDFTKVQLIGSGQWNDPQVYSSPAVAGGWFPAPDIGAYTNWAGRYTAMFAQEPVQKSTLVYDGVFLAAALVARADPAMPFDQTVLTNPQGALSAVNGLFRLNADGTNNRGLAVYQVVPGAAPRVISPAPRTFTGV